MTISPVAAVSLAEGPAFDLLQNPFALLNLPPDATREGTAAGFEDALADGAAGEEALREARRQLLAPKLRAKAVVEFLPDATNPERAEAIAALRENQPLSDLIALAKRLPTFARTTFLSEIAQVRPSSGLLRYFVQSLAQLNREVLIQAVGDFLENSGNPRPQPNAVLEVINEVTSRNAERLFVAYQDARQAARDVTQCLKEELPRANDEQLGILGVLVDAYSKIAAPILLTSRRNVEDAAERIRRGEAREGAIEALVEALNGWNAIAQPQKLLAGHKGRDEGSARDLFQFLRDLMLELANENDRPAVALAINRACQTVFAELPRAKRQLREDQGSLEELVDQEALNELGAFVENAKKDPDPLVRDLSRTGFNESSTGVAGSLYTLFGETLRKAQGTSVAGHAWGLVRILALELNNELGEASASQQLIEGLNAHPKFGEAPAKTRTALETDLRTVRSNALHAKLDRAVQEKDRIAARSTLVDLLAATSDPTEREQYQQVINKLDAANRGRLVRWAFWGVIALVVVSVAMTRNNSSSSSSSYRPTTTTYSAPPTTTYSTPATTRTESLEEIKPPVGSNRSFDRSNVRYCLYQSARLDAAKTMLATEKSNAVIAAFNRFIEDYNSRCGSYRYYPVDLSAVQAELITKDSALAAEGRQLVQTWRAAR